MQDSEILQAHAVCKSIETQNTSSTWGIHSIEPRVLRVWQYSQVQRPEILEVLAVLAVLAVQKPERRRVLKAPRAFFSQKYLLDSQVWEHLCMFRN